MEPQREITRLLVEVDQVYDELHRLARAYFRRERASHTLQPTALVNEAYVRLLNQRTPIESRSHFLALAATQMRRILVDYARRRVAARRGSAGRKVTLEEGMAVSEREPLEMIALDRALSDLGAVDPELSRLVELRFFGGLSIEETADILSVSTATVKRGWNSARAFLHRHIAGEAEALTASAENAG